MKQKRHNKKYHVQYRNTTWFHDKTVWASLCVCVCVVCVCVCVRERESSKGLNNVLKVYIETPK